MSVKSGSGKMFPLVVLLATCGLTAAPVFAMTCSDGSQSHAATQAEANAATPGSIVAGITQVCSGDASLGVSGTVGNAKAYLNSLPKKCVGGCAAPPDQAHINKLNDTFAVCAANFLKAYTQQYGTIYITSAYRDGPSGENARAGGAPGSNHTKGLAMDVYPANGDFKTLWNYATQNPQFGVCFPHEGQGGGLLDRPHMILAGIGGTEGAKCTALGVSKPCSGAPALNFTPAPATYDNSDGTGEAGASGLAPLAPMPSGQQIPPGYCMVNANPLVFKPCTNAFPPLTPIQPTAPAQTMATQTTTPTPIQYVQPTSSLSTLLFSGTSINGSAVGTTSQDAANLLSALAGTPSSSTLASAPAISLNLNGGAQLLPTPQPMVPVQYNPTAAQPIAQQTFTSGDLGGNGGPAIPPQTSTFSPVQQILASMRSVLLGMLSYLQNL